jgi:hypothetical protein
MKFNYRKLTPAVILRDGDPEVVHIFSMEGNGMLEIEASKEGVKITADTLFFQPVDEEMKIPGDFREFMVRLSSAFELAWKEQEKERKAVQARKSILSLGGRQ